VLVRLLERYQRLVRLAAVAVCVLFGARALADVIDAMEGASAWAADTRPARPAAKPPAATAAIALDKSGDALAERNLFCSTCTVALPDEKVAEAPSGVPPTTSLPLRLIATHVASGDASGSRATVQDSSSSHQGAYRMGDSLPGAGAIVRIGGRSVDFQNPAAGRVERLAIVEATAPAAAPEEAAPAATDVSDRPRPDRRRAADPQLTAELDAGVRSIDATTFEVDRGLIERVIARPQAAARGARVSLREGGLRVSGVRPDSAHARLGLQSGDTILAVNGVDLSSPDKMLEAVSQLRNESRISLSVTRKRQPVTLTYHIR
jgi:type II secretory pathway component PulC